MPDKRSLYEQVILDHNKAPRNFGELPDADRKAEGYNALCGDQFTIFLKMDGDIIDTVQFEGSGCAISKSSASVMTTQLKGKTRSEAEALFQKFHAMITSGFDSELDEAELGKLMVFSGVREYPVRIKCATLAWHTMLSALHEEDETVSTE
jgi:nitrogen fixation NifU-like protein